MKYIVWISIVLVVLVGISWMYLGRQSSLDTSVPTPQPAELSPLSVGPSRLTVPVSVPLQAFQPVLEQMTPETMSGSSEVGFGIQTNWSVLRAPFTVAQDDGNVMISTDLNGSVTFTKEILIEARTTINLQGKAWLMMRPRINQEWKIIPNMEMGVEIFQQEHEIFNLISIDLSKFIQPHVTAIVNKAGESLERFVSESDLLEELAKEEWMKLCRSVIVSTDPDLWLEIDPRAIRASQIQIEDGDLRFQLGIDTAMRTSSSETEPTCEFPEQLVLESDKPNKIQIVLLAEIDYETLEEALSEVAAGQTLGRGFPITIQKFNIHPHGTSLMVEVQVSVGAGSWLTRLGSGTVYVFAKPDLSADGQVISLSQVELETSSRSTIIAALGEAAEPLILDLLEGQATFRLDAVRGQLLDRINTALDELSSGKIEVDAKINDIRLTRLDVGPEYLRGVAKLDGRATVAVREISFEAQ